MISGSLADRWADKPIAEIDRNDIHDLIDEVKVNGVPGVKRLTVGVTKSRAGAMLACLHDTRGWWRSEGLPPTRVAASLAPRGRRPAIEC